MSITVILGAQWGDEGKGRFTDALAHNANIVARFNGGDNAGHSITIGDQVVKLHMLTGFVVIAGLTTPAFLVFYFLVLPRGASRVAAAGRLVVAAAPAGLFVVSLFVAPAPLR